MANNKKLAEQVLDAVGGKDNVTSVTHCMTRLRFTLKDQGIPKDDEVKDISGVVGVVRAGGQIQVIVGTGVGEVHSEIIRLGGFETQTLSPRLEKQSLLDSFTGYITAAMTPVLGVLGACALIASIGTILTITGVMADGSGAAILFNAMGNAVLTFFPVLLGYTSARALKMDPFVGIAIGLVLVFPGITESFVSGEPLFTLFAGSMFEQPIFKTFFGIPVMFPSNGYASTVIPILFATLVASKIEKVFNKLLPQSLKQMILPMVTILVTIPIAILVVGPISNMLSSLMMAGVTWLMSKSLLLTVVVVALVYQPLVILGLHWALISVAIIEFMTTGQCLMISMLWPASFAHMAVCLAVYFATKDKREKELALPAVISAAFCIIEPSIYGITLPVKKRFLFCMISGTIGGVILAMTNAPMYAIAMGALGFGGFIDPNTGSTRGMIMAFVAVGVTMAIGFALTWVSCKMDAKKSSSIRGVSI